MARRELNGTAIVLERRGSFNRETNEPSENKRGRRAAAVQITAASGTV